MRRARAVLLVLLASALAPPASASALLRPVVTSHGSYGESYTFIADLEDGGYLHLSLGLTNLGPGSVKGLCQAVVVGAEGGPWKASDRVGRDGWRWEAGETERLTIGPCAAWTGAAGGGVEVKLDGGSVRLAFGAPLALHVPPESTLILGQDFYRTEILLSRVRVTGTIALPGHPPRAVVGAAYVDHSRSTVKPRDLARRWVRFRALRGGRGLLLLGREGYDGRFTPAWACEAQGPCRRFPSFRIDRTGEKTPAFHVALTAEDVPVSIASGRLLFRDAPVEDLGVLGKIVAPFVGSPVTYVYRGQLSGFGAPLDGILEVQLDEE